MNSTVRFLLSLCTPHALVMARHRHRMRRLDRLQRDSGSSVALTEETEEHSYQASIRYLMNFRLDQNEVQAGSIPEPSLKVIATELERISRPGFPLRVLHVGNFVGVSVSYVAAACRRLHEHSVVIAIDPDITHRGIENPQKIVTKVLERFGLQRTVILICGYSGQRNPGDDGGLRYGPQEDGPPRLPQEVAPENVLFNLSHFIHRSLDAAVIDGNHDAAYLETEIDAIVPLIRPGGLLFLDDVTASWPGIESVFRERCKSPVTPRKGFDGRIGILELRPGPVMGSQPFGGVHTGMA